MKHILALSPSELENFLKSIGEKPWRVRQIYRWIYKSPHNFIQSFENMTDLSIDLRRQLAKNFYLSALKLIKTKSSLDGTIRYDFSTSHSSRKIFFSTVYIPSFSDLSHKKLRHTICLSTQSGCPVGCLFCASSQEENTNHNSPIYSLTKGEIIESYLITRAMVLTDKEKKVEDIFNSEKFAALFMGSGEPFLNYNNVCSAIDDLVSDDRIGLSARDVVLSTVGIKPEMISRFTRESLNKDKKIRLAVSLHTVDDKLRQILIPLKNLPPVEEILKEAFNYASATKTRLTLECVMIKGVTDTDERIKNLALIVSKFIKKYHLKKEFVLNLIPFNQNKHGEEKGFQPSDEKDILQIKNFLISRGIFTIIRSNRGQDISSACGQLDTSFID